MGIDDAWSIREPRAFTWWGHRLAQRVWAEPARESDGFVIVRLGAETQILRNVPNTRAGADHLADFNYHASMSALVWNRAEATINLRCGANVHPATAEFVKLLLTAACGLTSC